MGNEAVIVMDFDKTIMGCDSDNWVVDELGFNDLFTHLLPTLPWNSLMDRMMMEIHSSGKTIDDIAECLKRAPIDPNIISAIKSAHDLGCDMRILSDANVFFIETILKHHGIMDCFKEIKTNPSFIDGQGRLRISPYHGFDSPSHGCNICPPNMCKGLMLERIRASLSVEGKKGFIYVGDGTADFCAGLKLEENDYMLPRKDFPVWDTICKNPTLIKAKIHEWRDWEELKTLLLNTAKTLVLRADDQVVLLDCKFQDCNALQSAHHSALRIPQWLNSELKQECIDKNKSSLFLCCNATQVTLPMNMDF